MTYILKKWKKESYEIEYNEGFKHKIFFDNDYGISLVYHSESYGLECALIHKDSEGLITDNKKFNISKYQTIRPFLNGDSLAKVLKIVKNLPRRN